MFGPIPRALPWAMVESPLRGYRQRIKRMSFLAVYGGTSHALPPMGDYPGRRQVRTRAKRAVKNDRIIEQRAAEKKAAKPAATAKK